MLDQDNNLLPSSKLFVNYKKICAVNMEFFRPVFHKQTDESFDLYL